MDAPALVERRSSSPAPSDAEAQTDYAQLMEDGGQSQGDSTRSGPVHTAVLLAIGSELTSGETRDTNGGDLARWLARRAWMSFGSRHYRIVGSR